MKKGFTLIELLAVIVILAIIALIATPIVLGIINDSKESAILRSAEFYTDAVKNGIMKKNLELNGTLNPNTCEVIGKEKVKCGEVEIEVEVDGEVPNSGSITFNKGKVTGVNLMFGNKNVSMNPKGQLVLEDNAVSEDTEQEQKLAPGLYDENDNLLISWDDLTSMDYHKVTYPVLDEDGNLVNKTSSILNVSEDGTVTSTPSNYDDVNYSAEYLVGKLVLDESVTSIGYGAFEGCTNLTSITISDSVTSIGYGAFRRCCKLTSVTIGNGVTSIGYGAFQGCSKLTSVTIGNNVTSIESYAFDSCSSLTSITIPDSVTNIDVYAFLDCSKLTSVTIGNSVTIIEPYTFQACVSLTSVTIGNSVTSIEMHAFLGCSSLTNITIPDSVTYIEPVAFQGCNHLTTIYYKGTASGEPWGATNATIVRDF